ncbi:MFS transporter [Streptomyces sp. NPDC058045]|uniref:MFS transporter n=1 Tax=Streptomyces sp. NPDC058045 TaxID=3346311 RepID=UPI0036ECA07B
MRVGVRAARDRLLRTLGGPQQARAILLLGAVLGLDGADKGTVSTMAGPLKAAFGVGNTEIGLLGSVTALAGGLFTLPVGVLTDRVCRTRLLALSVALWAVATALSALAPSYLWMLVSRVALGGVAATTGPTVASLVGDYFPGRDRARVYGMVLGGELVGTGIGFAVSSAVGSALGWRFAFWWLVIPSSLLVWAVWRQPEPARGGPGLPGGEPTAARKPPPRPPGVPPDKRMVLRRDPGTLPLWRAVVYVLRIRTNLVLIVASALGYFFFAGLRSFATLFATHQYGVSTSVAGLLVLVVAVGSLAGVLVGGRIADRLGRRRNDARVLVPTVCLLTMPFLAAPAFHSEALPVALPLLMCSTALLGAANPPLDAARLDIVPPLLWGRAEATRTVLRTAGEAVAPTLFGWVSVHVFTGGDALQDTLLLFLLPLFAAGGLGLLALRTYPRDVATATASVHALTTGGKGGR